MSDIKAELEKAGEAKTAMDANIKKQKAELEQIAKEVDELKAKFTTMENEDNLLVEDMKHKNKTRKAIVAQLASDKEKLQDLEETQRKNEIELKQCQKLKEEHEVSSIESFE